MPSFPRRWGMFCKSRLPQFTAMLLKSRIEEVRRVALEDRQVPIQMVIRTPFYNLPRDLAISRYVSHVPARCHSKCLGMIGDLAM